MTEGNGAGARPPPSGGPGKRFYSAAGVTAAEGGLFRVVLDGRSVRTPARRLVEVGSPALAEALAQEWQAQGERIEPATMPLTRMVNSALDGVADRLHEVAADIARYAGSDLICYRADHPAELIALQARAWDPLIAWASMHFGHRIEVAAGIMHVAQHPALVGTIGDSLRQSAPLQLAALHVMTTLTGSALIALAHTRQLIDAEAAWAAAHVDEDWQIQQWGEDAEAARRRQVRHAEFLAASRLHRLASEFTTS